MSEECNHPDCDENATEAYVDANGNGLSLCDEHYFDAVYPGGTRVVEHNRVKPDSDEAPAMLESLFGGAQR